MKKIILLTILFLVVACNKTNSLEKEYYSFVKETELCETTTEDIPFNVDITLEKLTEDYWIYRLYLDEPTIEMNNIKAIITHNYETTDIFPTSGLYEKPLTLDPNEINQAKNKVKGIILVGYIKTKDDINKIIFKVLIKYNDRSICYEEIKSLSN